ncbi:MFS transporter [Luteipulveratus sp. YIM 133132]|uniref:MFS transporter n=1 Tax=Luteipulveratus flavus TaxID=3031728 RepID=UPI0023B07083|nr:MFS transporter [Luteipulveratus sp. YIM 133132]MDE9365601.1 MFS transporter [Luteipulveratus sp. YIM 133132]
MAQTERLTGRRARALGASIVLLELAASVSTFVAQTLLPVIVSSFRVTSGVGVLVSGATVGLFVALPSAAHLLGLLGSRSTLLLGMLATLVGGVVSATADGVWSFAVGRFIAGFAGGLLGVFGVSAAVKHLDDDTRKVVIALSSAMWLLPGLVGPVIIVGLEHLIGWRWTLLTPIPIVLGARALIVRAVPPSGPVPGRRPVVRTLLVPVGVVGFLLAGTNVVGWALLLVAAFGFVALVPAGTVTMRRGAPAGLLSLTTFAVGYFGAGTLITLLFTGAYGAPLAEAGIGLGVASVGWAVASLVLTRVERTGRSLSAAAALLVSAGCIAGVGLLGALGAPFLLGAVLWAVAGVGVGLFYPTVYVRATTPSGSLSEEQVATAAITAEAFGGLVGGAVGGVLVSGSNLTPARFAGAYGLFAAALAVAALAAARSGTGAGPAP